VAHDDRRIGLAGGGGVGLGYGCDQRRVVWIAIAGIRCATGSCERCRYQQIE